MFSTHDEFALILYAARSFEPTLTVELVILPLRLDLETCSVRKLSVAIQQVVDVVCLAPESLLFVDSRDFTLALAVHEGPLHRGAVLRRHRTVSVRQTILHISTELNPLPTFFGFIWVVR